MKSKKPYSRRISSEEAKKGYVLVLKNALSMFPAQGKPFELHGGTQPRKAAVESYHCQCQGPDLPHDHYFIRWEGLKRGDRVTISKDEKNAGTYSLHIRK